MSLMIYWSNMVYLTLSVYDNRLIFSVAILSYSSQDKCDTSKAIFSVRMMYVMRIKEDGR